MNDQIESFFDGQGEVIVTHAPFLTPEHLKTHPKPSQGTVYNPSISSQDPSPPPVHPASRPQAFVATCQVLIFASQAALPLRGNPHLCQS
ncbi:hypothetical protein JAAARDRAFT_588301 [Jaapia argillacea MUCL 33604]|uniref:Uncharacterized protein n=1 Tax=Jaapia argillacea MUCL 33604 TaxID=933084 RepID=A0A067P5N6_9AGAM|nr:hypothetical protein JAAARDRAFT_588301 [Jaapia argillacea MUCL 33604]